MGEGGGSRGENQILQPGVQHIGQIASQGDVVEGVGDGWFCKDGEILNQMELEGRGLEQEKDKRGTH